MEILILAGLQNEAIKITSAKMTDAGMNATTYSKSELAQKLRLFAIDLDNISRCKTPQAVRDLNIKMPEDLVRFYS